MADDQRKVIGLTTLQFANGGLFDGRDAGDGFAAHLVRRTRTGTPGPTLCGIDRFAETTPGWSVGGGISGVGVRHIPCPGCLAGAAREFPGLPVSGLGSQNVEHALGAFSRPEADHG